MFYVLAIYKMNNILLAYSSMLPIDIASNMRYTILVARERATGKEVVANDM